MSKVKRLLNGKTKTMKKFRSMPVTWIGSVWCGMLAIVACTDVDHPGVNEPAAHPVVRANIAAYEQQGEAMEGENKVNHVQACQFIDGTMAEVYGNLSFDGSSCDVPLTRYEGSLYVLANTEGVIDLKALQEQNMTEEEWKKTVVDLKEGKEVAFFSGSLDLEGQDKAQVVLPLSLKRGVARFDMQMQVAGTIEVKSLTMKNVARETHLFARPDVHSPDGVTRRDTTVTFAQPLTTDTPGVFYAYGQANDGVEVSVTAVIDGEEKTLTKRLSEPVLRNTVNKIIVRKDYISVSLDVTFDEWEPGHDTELDAQHQTGRL